MYGFLIHDERLFPTIIAVGACRALRTYNYQTTEHLGPLRIHFFCNASLNNYFVKDERYTICVAGTMIFDNVHSSRALSNLLGALHSGRELADLFNRLQGPFTLIQIDRVIEQVTILNSREGLHNFYMAARTDLRVYSTNLLLIAALTDATPCAEGIRQFIHIGATMDGKTIFENVERVSAAALHTYCNERWTTSRLWRLKTSTTDRGVTRQIATKTLIEAFNRNFEFTSNIDSGRVVADLTGGTDSRTVLCCLLEQHANAVASTSGSKNYVDVRIARKLADKLGIEHYWYKPTLEQMTDKRIDRAVEIADGNQDAISLVKRLPYYEERARRFDLITGGNGGPLFKDHYWLFEFNRVGLGREPNWDRIAKFSLAAHALRDDYFSGFNDRIMDNLSELFRHHSTAVSGTNNQKLDFVYFNLKVPAVAGQAFSLTTQFMDTFHPMLDGDNVQYSINLPPEIRIRNILQFDMIRCLRPELSWIVTDTGLPTIPPVGTYGWLRVMRGRRYVETGFRKLRTAFMGFSGQKTNYSTDIEELQTLGYFDLIEHSSLAFSSIVASAKLAEFKESPGKQPNQSYLIGTLSLQLFFERVKELRDEAKKWQQAQI